MSGGVPAFVAVLSLPEAARHSPIADQAIFPILGLYKDLAHRVSAGLDSVTRV